MREPYGEGVASRSDPESCVVVREDGGEALTGARMGPVLSREITESGAKTLLSEAEHHAAVTAIARSLWAPRGRRPDARAETPCARTGRSPRRPRVAPRTAPGRPEAVIR